MLNKYSFRHSWRVEVFGSNYIPLPIIHEKRKQILIISTELARSWLAGRTSFSFNVQFVEGLSYHEFIVILKSSKIFECLNICKNVLGVSYTLLISKVSLTTLVNLIVSLSSILQASTMQNDKRGTTGGVDKMSFLVICVYLTGKGWGRRKTLLEASTLRLWLFLELIYGRKVKWSEWSFKIILVANTALTPLSLLPWQQHFGLTLVKTTTLIFLRM